MSEARKRKRHSFSDPSTLAAPLSVAGKEPNPPRRTLQRASKDRAYAERLAAAGENHGFIGPNVASVASAGDKGSRKSEDGNRAKQTRTKKRRESVPSGWPFTDPSIRSKSAKSREKPAVRGRSRQESKQRRGTVKQKLREELVVSMKENVSPDFRKEPNDQSISSSAESKRVDRRNSSEQSQHSSQQSDEADDKKVGNISLNGLQDISTHTNASESSDEVVIHDKLELKEYEDGSCSKQRYKQPQRQALNPTNPSKPTKTWTCTRCTLTNSNRRKKCEVCGNLRHLSVSSDGTFALSDGRSSSSDIGSSSDNRSSQCVSAEVKHQILSSNDSPEISSVTLDNNALPTDTDLLAIASQPVATRSKFKQLRLSQGMTPTDDSPNYSQQSSASSGDSVQHNPQNGNSSSTSEASSNENCTNDIDDKAVAFRESIKKRRNDRHTRQRNKRIKRYLQKTGKMEVAVRLSDVDGKNLSNDGILVAYVPSTVLSRRQVAGDKPTNDLHEEPQYKPNEHCDGAMNNSMDNTEIDDWPESMMCSSANSESCGDQAVPNEHNLLDISVAENTKPMNERADNNNDTEAQKVSNSGCSESVNDVRVRLSIDKTTTTVELVETLVASVSSAVLSRIKFAVDNKDGDSIAHSDGDILDSSLSTVRVQLSCDRTRIDAQPHRALIASVSSEVIHRFRCGRENRCDESSQVCSESNMTAALDVSVGGISKNGIINSLADSNIVDQAKVASPQCCSDSGEVGRSAHRKIIEGEVTEQLVRTQKADQTETKLDMTCNRAKMNESCDDSDMKSCNLGTDEITTKTDSAFNTSTNMSSESIVETPKSNHEQKVELDGKLCTGDSSDIGNEPQKKQNVVELNDMPMTQPAIEFDYLSQVIHLNSSVTNNTHPSAHRYHTYVSLLLSLGFKRIKCKQTFGKQEHQVYIYSTSVE